MQALIYTKPHCPFCVRAKELLTIKGISYNEIFVDGSLMTKEKMNKELGQAGLTTVPQIVLNGEFIPGGYTGLVKHFGLSK